MLLLFLKKTFFQKKVIIELSVNCQAYQKSLKGVLTSRCLNILKKHMSKYQCGFLKGDSTQHALIPLIEKWCNNVDQGSMFEALLTGLSIAFDCLPDETFTATLYIYGFDMEPLDFIYDYLRNCKQRIKTRIAPGKTYHMKFLKDQFLGFYELM